METQFLKVQTGEYQEYTVEVEIPGKQELKNDPGKYKGLKIPSGQVAFSKGILGTVDHTLNISICSMLKPSGAQGWSNRHTLNYYLCLDFKKKRGQSLEDFDLDQVTVTTMGSPNVWTQLYQTLDSGDGDNDDEDEDMDNEYDTTRFRMKMKHDICESFWPETTTIGKFRLKFKVHARFGVIMDQETIDRNFTPEAFIGSTFFNSGKFSDVQLKCGSLVIPGHKLVLSAKSEFFNTMFSIPMRENEEGIAQFDGENESAFLELIRFIYTGKIDPILLPDMGIIGELFMLGDKYGIPELFELCDKILAKGLNATPEKVWDLFVISHQVQKKGRLAKKSKEIVTRDKEKYIDVEKFKELSKNNSALLFEIYHNAP